MLASILPFGTFYINWKYLKACPANYTIYQKKLLSKKKSLFIKLLLEMPHRYYHHYLHQYTLILIAI